MKTWLIILLIAIVLILSGVLKVSVNTEEKGQQIKQTLTIPDTVYLSQELTALTPSPSSDLVIVSSAQPLEVAVRLDPPQTTTTLLAIPSGLWGQPFAPEGLTDCEEFDFYRIQWGLPDRFKALAWRESNCRNEDGVKTFCCYGYLQLYISLQIRDHRIVDRYALCGVFSFDDVNSDDPLEKQKQLCAAGVLYDVVGYSAWSL